jgi:hypothetical protein
MDAVFVTLHYVGTLHTITYFLCMNMQGYLNFRAEFFIPTIHNLKQKVSLSHEKQTYFLVL